MAWGPATFWAAVLFFLSSQQLSGTLRFPVNDKVVHFVLYAVLGGALAFGRGRAGWTPGHLLLLSIGLLYGLSDEIHQSFVPSRTASLGDWLADAVGLLAGYAGFLALSRRLGTER